MPRRPGLMPAVIRCMIRWRSPSTAFSLVMTWAVSLEHPP